MRYRRVFENSNEMILEIDPETGKIHDVNPALCRRLGWSREDLLSSIVGVSDILPDADRWLGAALRGDPIATGAIACRTRSGDAVAVEGGAWRLTSSARGPALILLRDAATSNGGGESVPAVTTDGHAAEVLEASRELHALTYNLSHDLQAPLRAIRGFAQLVAEEHAASLDAEGRRLLDLILSSTVRMRLLVEGLTRFGELSKLVPRHEPLDMDAIAAGVVEEQRRAEAARPLSVALQPLPPACGDPDRIRDVWAQLVSNAAKFTRRTAAPAIEIGWEAGDGAYYVRDNGVGFDMQRADRLFELFQRLHSLDDFPGTGVGLAIAKRILQKHGGRIWAESHPEAGATFRFTLPA